MTPVAIPLDHFERPGGLMLPYGSRLELSYEIDGGAFWHSDTATLIIPPYDSSRGSHAIKCRATDILTTDQIRDWCKEYQAEYAANAETERI